MKIKIRLRFGLLALLLLSIDVGRADAQDDPTLLEGSWLIVQCHDSGQVDREPLGDHFLIEGTSLTVQIEGDEDISGEITINDQVEPAEIDLVLNIGDQQLLSLAIYRLDDKTLTLCMAPPGGDRPDLFETNEGDGRRLIILEREDDDNP